MKLPAKGQAMLKECQTAADAVAGILKRLQHLTVYRTEPYLSPAERETDSSESCRIIKFDG